MKELYNCDFKRAGRKHEEVKNLLVENGFTDSYLYASKGTFNVSERNGRTFLVYGIKAKKQGIMQTIGKEFANEVEAEEYFLFKLSKQVLNILER